MMQPEKHRFRCHAANVERLSIGAFPYPVQADENSILWVLASIFTVLLYTMAF